MFGGLRQRILGGALVLVGLAWGLDASGVGRPQRAAAGAAAPAAVSAPSRWQDLTETLAALRGGDYESIAPRLAHARRDLFAPGDALAALQVPLVEETLEAETPPPQTTERPFAERYRLRAVLLGRVPQAILNDDVLTLNSDVAGYRLVELRRDAAVFEALEGQERVELRLVPGPGTSGAAAERTR